MNMPHLRIYVVSVLIFFSLIASLQADTSGSSIDSMFANRDSVLVTGNDQSSFNDYMVRGVWVSALLVIALYFGLRWYRKKMGGVSITGSNKIRVLARNHLGPKQSIMIVRVENRKLVLGVTEQAINLISDLGETDETEDALPATASQQVSFAKIFEKLKKDKIQ